MKTKHTQGKLIINYPDVNNDKDEFIIGEDQIAGCIIIPLIIIPVNEENLDETEANAKRIVKCWNMHDEMLEALKMCINHVGVIANESEPARNVHNKIKELIQKATK